MNFFVYAEQKVSGQMLAGPEFRAMLEEGDPSFAKLDGTQVHHWVELERSLGQYLLEYALNDMRNLHDNKAFLQEQHDNVKMANKHKYCARGLAIRHGFQQLHGVH